MSCQFLNPSCDALSAARVPIRTPGRGDGQRAAGAGTGRLHRTREAPAVRPGCGLPRSEAAPGMGYVERRDAGGTSWKGTTASAKGRIARGLRPASLQRQARGRGHSVAQRFGASDFIVDWVWMFRSLLARRMPGSSDVVRSPPSLGELIQELKRDHRAGFVYRGQAKKYEGPPLLPSQYRPVVLHGRLGDPRGPGANCASNITATSTRSAAPWQLTLHANKSDAAVSSTPVQSESDEPDGRKKVVFAETKPLPSYLVALGVGPFRFRGRRKNGQEPHAAAHDHAQRERPRRPSTRLGNIVPLEKCAILWRVPAPGCAACCQPRSRFTVPRAK